MVKPPGIHPVQEGVEELLVLGEAHICLCLELQMGTAVTKMLQSTHNEKLSPHGEHVLIVASFCALHPSARYKHLCESVNEGKGHPEMAPKYRVPVARFFISDVTYIITQELTDIIGVKVVSKDVLPAVGAPISHLIINAEVLIVIKHVVVVMYVMNALVCVGRKLRRC